MLNALYVVLGGMGIVFATLGVVLLVMVVLGRFSRPKAQHEE